jgi:hypothetical protein
MSAVIYKIYGVLNPKSNKYYIGKTKYTLLKRKNEHIMAAKRKTKSHKFYDCILSEYDSLIWFIIEDDLIEDNVNEREQYYINFYDSFNNGYNGTLGGDGGDTWSNNEKLESFKEKRRLNWLGKKNPNYGSPLPEEQKLKMIITKTGVSIHNDEYRIKLSERLREEWGAGKRKYYLSEHTNNRLGVTLTDEHKTKISDSVKTSEKYKIGLKIRSINAREKYNKRIEQFIEYLKENKTKNDIMNLMSIKESTYYKYKKEYESKIY